MWRLQGASLPSHALSRARVARWDASSPKRWASLSAIHVGRRREERARPQGRRTFRRETPESRAAEPAQSLTFAERRRARAAAPQPTLRIRKGKKDITHTDGPRPKSRQARFYDPADNFGKKSLVYQAKTGQLQSQLGESDDGDTLSNRPSRSGSRSGSAASFSREAPYFGNDMPKRPGQDSRGSREPRGPDRTRADDSGQNGSPWDTLMAASEGGRDRKGSDDRRFQPRQQERDHRRNGSGREVGERSGERHFQSRQGRDYRWDGPGREEGERGGERHFQSRQGRDYRRDGPGHEEGERSGERHFQSRQGRDHHRSGSGREDGGHGDNTLRKVTTDRQPVSVPYTTAASQFLYGKSVVEAALRASRRKLYKLYVYGGANRQNLSRDFAVQRLAERKGVEVQTVGEDGLRLMEKMSTGRPHNGYVLEASPLPQLPLVGLGPVSEDESKPGFHVNVAHQSAEDAEINGTANFIPHSGNSHKPLVVVLDQILDPGNFGAILRTVSFLGATAVAVTKRNSASLTPVALKASAGASEALTVFSVESLSDFLVESKENGWQVYAAAPSTARSRSHRQVDVHELQDLDPLSKTPCILLMGSEGEGLSRQLMSKADVLVNIPNLSGSNVVDSLNVSVATGLVCSEFLRGKVKSQFAMLNERKQETGLW